MPYAVTFTTDGTGYGKIPQHRMRKAAFQLWLPNGPCNVRATFAGLEGVTLDYYGTQGVSGAYSKKMELDKIPAGGDSFDETLYPRRSRGRLVANQHCVRKPHGRLHGDDRSVPTLSRLVRQVMHDDFTSSRSIHAGHLYFQGAGRSKPCIDTRTSEPSIADRWVLSPEKRRVHAVTLDRPSTPRVHLCTTATSCMGEHCKRGTEGRMADRQRRHFNFRIRRCAYHYGPNLYSRGCGSTATSGSAGNSQTTSRGLALAGVV